MYNRNLYIEKIRPFISKPVIKVITGMRRVGKSCFLQMIINELNARNISSKNILCINKESLDFDFVQNYRDLNRYVKDVFSGVEGTKYLFVDEIQEIENWEKGVASFFSDGDFVEVDAEKGIVKKLLNKSKNLK